MPHSRLHPNSPRKRIAYVKKSMGDRVARATAYVMAHTLGVERIFEDEPIESYFDDGLPHPSEALIPWAGQYLAKLLRAVEKGNLSRDEFFERQDDLERVMPQIATWVHHTRPDLTKLSVDEAIQQASAFEDPGASSDVPQGEVIYRFADGWTIQNLTTPEQIFADGDRVQHCLREDRYGPSYAAAVQAGDVKIFSLRKPSGIPVISIEYDVPTKLFKQIYAKQNTALGVQLADLLENLQWENRPEEAKALWQDIQKYKPRIREFLAAFGAKPQAFFMADVEVPDHLIDKATIDGDLQLGRFDAKLPDGIERVTGSIGLAGYPHPLPAGLTSVGDIFGLFNYHHPLPDGLERVTRSIALEGYPHPLPAGLTSVGDIFGLFNYHHPLPAGLTSVYGDLDLTGYDHPLPAGLTRVGGGLRLTNYKHPLPAGLTSVGENLDLTDYNHPLPAGLTSVEGSIYLYDYPHPLPAGLTSVGGYLNLTNYNHPLPAGLTRVGGSIDFSGYPHPLPAGLTSVGGSLNLSDYGHRLPAGLTSVGRLAFLGNYPHPLPAGLTSVGSGLRLTKYKHPLPAGLTSVYGNLILDNYHHPLPAGLTHVSGYVDVGDYPYSLAQLGIESARGRLRKNHRRTSRRPTRKTSRRTRRTSRK